MGKVLFIQHGYFPLPAAFSLAGMVKHSRHDFVLGLLETPQSIISLIKKEKPTLIGFSCTTGIYSKALSCAREIKKEFDTPIIFGGYHPTLSPEIIEDDGVDMICRGEGEYALVDLLNAIDLKTDYTKIENLWIKEGNLIHKNEIKLIPDLDDLPFSDYSIYKDYPRISNGSVAYVSFGRGCAFNCSYCCTNAIKKLYKNPESYVRFYSEKRILDEAHLALKSFPKSNLFLPAIENLFNKNEEYVENLLLKFSQHFSIPLLILIRIEHINERFIQILSRSNYYMLGIGLESGSEKIRNEILKKKFSNDRIFKIAELLHENKIRFQTYNMLGIPGETLSDVWETIFLNQKIRPTIPIVSMFTPYPSTELYETAKSNNLLIDGFSFNMITPHFAENPFVKCNYKNQMINIRSFFYPLVKYPGLLPFIKILIKFPPNILYYILFLLMETYVRKRILNLNFFTLLSSIRMELFHVLKSFILKGTAPIRTYFRKSSPD